MKIIFWGKEERGIRCLRYLHENGYLVDLVVAQPSSDYKDGSSSIGILAQQLGIEAIEPENIHTPEIVQYLRQREPDLFILVGYGRILGRELIDIPKKMAINLHAGKLPQYRGSSPLNWVLINGEETFTLSIIKLESGIDAGDILAEKTFDININDTIADLHHIANQRFPLMLEEVIKQIIHGACKGVPQDHSKASYFPLRFPEDGLILWDRYTAKQIHNRIRALTNPYPGAVTFYHQKKVKLLESKLADFDHLGEPGRVYRKSGENGLLVCASDKCLWIRKAILADGGNDLFGIIQRYDQLATLAGLMTMQSYPYSLT